MAVAARVARVVNDSAMAWLSNPPPVLTTRRACLFADCSRTKLQRSGPAPIGKCGTTLVYSTQSIIDWMTSGLDMPAAEVVASTSHKPMRSSATTRDALERLRALKHGAAR